MKMIFLFKLIMISIFCFISFCQPLLAADPVAFAIDPGSNKGEKWKIGYYEGGYYSTYPANLMAIVKNLEILGWIKPVQIPTEKTLHSEHIRHWLANNSKSEYIEFAHDAYYSAMWDDEIRKSVTDQIIERLTINKDIDLMIAAGTWAGQNLANNRHNTPTIVISTSDPIGAGIIKSVEDSGYDHINAPVDPFRYERQIKVFYSVIGFKRLGLAFENTAAGKTYAALETVESVAAESGFDIVTCYTKDEVPDVKIAEESVIKCFEGFKGKVDAIYVTEQNGVNANSIPRLTAISNASGIPTFSMHGSEYVKAGFLMSLSQAGFMNRGRFFVETMAKIFNGAKAGELGQLFEDPPQIVINLKVAKMIGYDPPVDILGAADEIYQEISVPE